MLYLTLFKVLASKYISHARDLDLSESSDVIGHVTTHRFATCHFLLVFHWNRASIFNCFRGIRGPKTRVHTRKHRHTPQVILYSVPCNVLHWTDKLRTRPSGRCDTRPSVIKRGILTSDMYIDMCMSHWSFWSWFDVNRSSFDDYIREKRFLHFRSQWPWPLTFWAQICFSSYSFLALCLH